MTDAVFSLNIFETVVFITLFVLFMASTIALYVVLIKKLHIALHTISELRHYTVTLFMSQSKLLQKHNERMDDTNRELLKGIAKQLNITIENYR